jgi:hypothetical protein
MPSVININIISIDETVWHGHWHCRVQHSFRYLRTAETDLGLVKKVGHAEPD